MMPETLTFQDQLRILMEAVPAPDGRPYSLAAIAKASGLSQQNLSSLLEGHIQQPRLDTLRRLCRFYDISLDYFGSETENDCRAFFAQRAAEEALPIVLEIERETQSLTLAGKRNILRLLARVRQLRSSGKHKRENQ